MVFGQGRRAAPLPLSLNGDPVQLQSNPFDDPLEKEPLTPGLEKDFRKPAMVLGRRGITPYVALPSRLSQVWLNRWTVMLLLILVRILLRVGSLDEQLGDARIKALSACTKVEDIGSAVASGPHYLSVGVNHLIAHGITSAVSGMVDIMTMILTGVEALIMFVINWYIGTYICLIAAFVHGGLDVAVAVVEGADKFFNDNIGKVADGLGHSVDGINAAIDELWKVVGSVQGATTAAQGAINDAGDALKNAGQSLGNEVGSLLGGLHVRDDMVHVTTTVLTKLDGETLEIRALTEPHLDISGFLNSMRNIHINASQFVGDLVSLNNSIPTFDQAKSATQQAIGTPLDYVRGQLNATYGDWKFNGSALPVAGKEALTFCSTNPFIEDFFAGLYKTLVTAKYVMTVSFVVLAILACVFWGLVETRRWHSQKKRARLFSTEGYDVLDVVYIVERSFTAWLGVKVSSWRFFTNPRSKLLARWAVAYGTSLPALFILGLAVAGLLSFACQAVLFRLLQNEAPTLTAQVANFTQDVVQTLENVSMKWANDSNNHVVGLQDDINKDVLGWVVNATSAVNNTLNTIENEINIVLAKAFNGTVLYNTVTDVVRCLVTSKIDQVEKGLTWVHDNAHVTLPKFPDDVFSKGANESISGDGKLTSFLASPASVTSDEVSGALDHVLTTMHKGLVQELLISLFLLTIYIIVVLGGIVYALVRSLTPDRTLAGHPDWKPPKPINHLTIENTSEDDDNDAPLTGGNTHANHTNYAASYRARDLDSKRGQAF